MESIFEFGLKNPVLNEKTRERYLDTLAKHFGVSQNELKNSTLWVS